MMKITPPIKTAATLRSRAEGRLRKNNKSNTLPPAKLTDGEMRSLHELHVHQIELEMQNMELLEARNRTEELLNKYTDLYDFAPVGYFSLDPQGRILEANLTGAALLGVERSRLIHQRLRGFVDLQTLPSFLLFLENIFSQPTKQECVATLVKKGGEVFWADLHAVCDGDPKKGCRLAMSDITILKRADEAQKRVESLNRTNQELQREIVQKSQVATALKKSEQQKSRMLKLSNLLQEQLRSLSHQLLHAQEEERKRISRQLHDEIAQILVGISVHLESLTHETTFATPSLKTKIVLTQKLVDESVQIVQQLARDLRPAVLDDVGLNSAIQAYLKGFMEQTGIRVSFNTYAGAEKLKSAERTVLYRITQEALTNAARHAQASTAKVTLQNTGGTICLSVHDNGKGFLADKPTSPKGRKRLGIVGMRERVEMIGGTFRIDSAPGQQTTIHVEIPRSTTKALSVKKTQP